jgi:hypothetical protein
MRCRDLLITGKKDARSGSVVQPSGTVRGFNGQRVRRRPARRAFRAPCVRYDDLGLRGIDRRPFAYQARQLLNGLLQKIDRVQLGTIEHVVDLERVFSKLSDPSSIFPASFRIERSAPSITLPDWRKKPRQLTASNTTWHCWS